MATITKFNKGLQNQFNGTAVVDYDTDTIKVALWNDTTAPSATTWDYYADVTSSGGTEMANGNGYTTGGATLSTKSLTESGGTVTFDADDVTWTVNANGFETARYAIIYKDTGSGATSPLIGYIDFGSAKGNKAGDLTIQWGASGIFTVV